MEAQGNVKDLDGKSICNKLAMYRRMPNYTAIRLLRLIAIRGEYGALWKEAKAP